VFQQAGQGTNTPADGASLNLHPITVSLASFAGHSLQFRFNYHYDSGAYLTPSDFDGWYFDNVVFSGLQAVTASVVTAIGATNTFSVIPPATGDYQLEARGLVEGTWPLAWSRGKSIAAAAGPSFRFTGVPMLLGGGQVQLEFSISNYVTGVTLQLDSTDRLDRPWTPETNAVLQVVSPQENFRFQTKTTGTTGRFYRVRGN
jgi:hypothetical protein